MAHQPGRRTGHRHNDEDLRNDYQRCQRHFTEILSVYRSSKNAARGIVNSHHGISRPKRECTLAWAKKPARIVPTRQPGAPVRWKDRAGVYRRDIGDGEHSEIAVADRVYR